MHKKIQLTDSFTDIIVKLSEGNPGACTALMELFSSYEKIDPQSAFGAYSPLLSFDSHGIYGSSIYVIWNDKCQRSSRKVAILLRATQLGILSAAKLKEMAADQMREINLTGEEWSEIDKKVCEQLDEFQKPK